MTLRVRHVDGHRIPVTVVEGVESDEAVRCLGRNLRDGSAFDSAEALVIDLSQVPDVSTAALEILDEASHVWEHDRRWLAVSGIGTTLAVDTLYGHRYLSPRRGTDAAQRFFRIVAGYTSRRDHFVSVATAGVSIVEGVVVATVSTVARIGETTRRVMRRSVPTLSGRRE